MDFKCPREQSTFPQSNQEPRPSYFALKLTFKLEGRHSHKDSYWLRRGLLATFQPEELKNFGKRYFKNS